MSLISGKNLFLFFLLLVLPYCCKADYPVELKKEKGTYKMNAKDLKKKDPDQIIEFASVRLREMAQNYGPAETALPANFPKNFDLIQAWERKDTLKVVFTHKFQYIPLKSAVISQVIYILNGQQEEQNFRIDRNPADFETSDEIFFQRDENTIKLHDIVRSAFKKGDLRFPVGMRVFERKDAYEVRWGDDFIENIIIIDKKKGRVIDESHAHKPAVDEQKFKRIK